MQLLEKSFAAVQRDLCMGVVCIFCSSMDVYTILRYLARGACTNINRKESFTPLTLDFNMLPLFQTWYYLRYHVCQREPQTEFTDDARVGLNN